MITKILWLLATLRQSFRRALRDLGYIEGKNILLENRYAQGNHDRIPSLVGELVQLKLDVFLTENPTAPGWQSSLLR